MNNKTDSANAAALCIGVANVDVLASVDTGFLVRHRIDRGTSTLMRSEDILTLIDDIGKGNIAVIPGGCAANTACGIASEGINTRFAGMIHDDSYGQIFRDGFIPYGVAYDPAIHPEKKTSLCLTLVTPDKDRSFVISPSAASWFLAEDNLPERDPAQDLIVYTESNLFRMTAGTTRQSMLHAVIDKYRGDRTRIVLNLIDTEITTHHRQTVLDLIGAKSFALVISNQNELMSLFKASNQDEAFAMAQKSGQTFITTLGRDGAMIIDLAGLHPVAGSGLAMEDIVDTVGAGDQFSAGVVATMARGGDLNQACLNGTRRAIDILGLEGARPRPVREAA